MGGMTGQLTTTPTPRYSKYVDKGPECQLGLEMGRDKVERLPSRSPLLLSPEYTTLSRQLRYSYPENGNKYGYKWRLQFVGR
jgi:hypothetical protein